MFKLEFPAENKTLAAAIGRALLEYGTGEVTAGAIITHTIKKEVGDVALTETVTTEPVKTTATQDPVESTAILGAGSAPAAQGTDNTDRNNLDEKGVGKNPDFCSNAQIPFFQSGKKKGQWKKKQGVDEADYDAWYGAELANANPANQTAASGTPVDTGAAFGNRSAAANASGETFANAGEFMAWVAEQQAADRLTQADIDNAYQVTQVQVHDLFNPDLFDNAVSAVYQFLRPISEGA
jgi:hypothetical protein